MVGVVIGHDQDRAQVGLVGLAGRDRLGQIEGGVRDELLQPLAIDPDARDALVPCGIVGRFEAGRPVVVGPLQRVYVGGIEAEREQVGWRKPTCSCQGEWSKPWAVAPRRSADNSATARSKPTWNSSQSSIRTRCARTGPCILPSGLSATSPARL